MLAITAAACIGGGGEEPGGGGGTTTREIPTGGIIQGAMTGDVYAAFDPAFAPAQESDPVSWEYFRCCLLRTLMSYNGKPTGEGGAQIFPDLAAADPEISIDHLTWIFTLKSGIHYAPPFQDVEITAGDFVRALEREADPKANVNGYSDYYSVIKGFEEFARGDADSISGVSAPDEATLAVELNSPSGDLGYLFGMPATAPIPPNGDARLGAAEGHNKDYGRFLVATGPYMFAGSKNMDFSGPADQQTPVSGFVPGRSIELVRNPSWDRATDDLRPAYVDGFQITIGGDQTDLYNKVDAGELDIVVDSGPPPELLQKYSTDPTLQARLYTFPSDVVRYLSFNLAIPPFDDVHVRKAVNLAVDKAGLRQLSGGPLAGEIAGHIMVNSLQNDLLKDYDPYASPNAAGDLDAAKAEMALSNYDSDGDGVCDDPVCDGILVVTDESPPYPEQGALIQQNLELLGLELDIRSFQRIPMYIKCNSPADHVALCTAPLWGKTYADGSTFALPLFESVSISTCCNYSLVGASADVLKENGYEVTSVPSVDHKVADCVVATGDERFQCWADLDELLMTEVVPWVPYLFDNHNTIVSERIVNYSFDQFAGLDALDHLAIATEAQ